MASFPARFSTGTFNPYATGAATTTALCALSGKRDASYILLRAMHTDTDQFYATLGVAPTASEHVIRTAFRRRAKEVHPDVTGDASEDFVALKQAYDVLSDASA